MKLSTLAILNMIQEGAQKFLNESEGKQYSTMHNIFCYSIEIPKKYARQLIQECETLKKQARIEEVYDNDSKTHPLFVRKKALAILYDAIEQSKGSRGQSEQKLAVYRYISNGATTDDAFIASAGNFFGEERIKSALSSAKKSNFFMFAMDHRREAIMLIIDEEIAALYKKAPAPIPLREVSASMALS